MDNYKPNKDYRNKQSKLNARAVRDNSNANIDNAEEWGNAKVTWYLFFDLLQVSIDIMNLTRFNDIIILVGETPSYLHPFFKRYSSLMSVTLA